MEEQSECQAVKELNEQLKAVDEETLIQREKLRAEHAERLNLLAEADALKRKEIEEINEERRKQEEIEKELMEKEKKFTEEGNTEDASEVTDELEMTRDQHKATETLLTHREEKANKKYGEYYLISFVKTFLNN